MSPRVRTALVAAAGLIVTILALFGAVRTLRSGEILGSIAVAEHPDVELGGLTPDEAREQLSTLEQTLGVEPIPVDIEGRTTTVLPQQLGLRLDVDTMVELAMARGREGGLSDQFRWWLAHLFRADVLPTEGTLDPDAVEAVLAAWDTDVVGEPAVPGGVALEDVMPVPVYPGPGLQVDRSTAGERLLAASLVTNPEPVLLDTAIAVSRVTNADVDAAVARARLWLSNPVELTSEEVSLDFSVAELAQAFTSSVVDGVVILGFDPGVVRALLEAHRDMLEAPPVDARLEIDGYDVIIVPGRNGTLIDPEATAEALAQAASSVRRRAPLPFEQGAPPAVTTEDLEALGITHLVSEFTTYHPCCQNRVTNIHLMADFVDGAIVEPGATFGLNAYVGERTAERGFLEDGTIVQGELVETVGGGVSQFATTMYNAIFWGGYEDVAHRPHSFYFNRYPEGIEATISWQQPELTFRNDTESAVWIRTRYTDTSITISFYGSNDGRVLVGSHRDGATEIDIVNEGGPMARRVRASRGERYNPTEPRIEYRANPELDVEETKQLQSPAPGWTITVTRVIEHAGTEREQMWTVRYLARREIIEVHPCKMPEATEECPEPTSTTTLPPDTTTSTP